MASSEADRAVRPAPHARAIADGTDRLEMLDRWREGGGVAAILAALKRDQVALIRKAPESEADRILNEIAGELGLSESLQAQAAFAGILGHRQNVTRFFMTVNRRRDFAIVLPHSEGSRFTNIQLASFYCHENTTDGGVSLLLNCNQDSGAWQSMSELVMRLDPADRPLNPTQRAYARAKFMAEEFLGADDRFVEQRPSPIAGVRLMWALTPVRKSFSKILEREVHTYWDSVSSLDLDSAKEGVRLMSRYDLLREPAVGGPIDHYDDSYRRTRWSSGVKYDELFKAVIVRKLEPGDLILQNNLTWAHAASNWTPGSGTRRVIAAFA